MNLWRPVGLEELALLFDSGMRAFPPRLPEQPIFYPVLNPEYAAQIAREWNTQEGAAAGYVTRFEVPDSILQRYERRVVGSAVHEELWIPAEDLAAFNQEIQPPIVVESAFFGDRFRGMVATETGLKGKDARAQFVALANHLAYNRFDVWCEASVNRKAVFANYPFWLSLEPADAGMSATQKSDLLEFIELQWAESDIPFPLPQLRQGEPGVGADSR